MDPPFEQAFDDSQPLQLLSRVRDAYGRAEAPLIHDLVFHVRDLRAAKDAYKGEIRELKRKLEEAHDHLASADEPAAKKRKLPDHASATAPSAASAAAAPPAPWQQYQVAVDLPDISFSLPMRKKLRLQLVEGPSPSAGGIRVNAPGDGQQDTFMSWTDIEQVICVPVPEKAQPSYQFIAIPRASAPPASNATTAGPLMWSVPSTPPKTITINKAYAALPDATATPLDVLLRHMLDAHLHSVAKQTITPTPAEFSSQLVQAHRKDAGAAAYHVKAFRGSKEGFLYFLPTGILFAPRAPLLYFAFAAVSSISYSSVLQRTFNLNIAARLSPAGVPPDPRANGAGSDAETEFEFAMLDQADFAGIDAYVKRHGLHDASLAAHRRAKLYNVNPSQGAAGAASKAEAEADAAGGGGGDDGVAVANGVVADEPGESELAKAERALQDAEDEEEEDYDPSGGESEGSGSDSEEEEAAGYGVQDGEMGNDELQDGEDEEVDDV